MGAPRPVLFLAWAPFFSGAERALILTLRSLDPARYTPHVIAGTDGAFAEQVRALGIPCDIVPLVPLDARKIGAWVRSLWRVYRVVRRVRPSVIHSNDMPSYQPAGAVGRWLGIPCVTHLRFPAERAAYQWFFRPVFARAVFISESFRTDALAEAPELFGPRSTVIYDAVESVDPASPENRIARRLELGLPADRPVIAMTGQVAEIKGIWEFVAAASLLRDHDVIFAVLGDDLKSAGSVRREMEARVASLGLTSRFRFLGFRPNASKLVQLFDLVVAPSHVEPFGLASLEAMAAGLPVVATRVGGIPEVVEDGRTGLLVPARDAQALADAIAATLGDPVRAGAMGARGRERAEHVFGIAVHGRQLQALYDSLCSAS